MAVRDDIDAEQQAALDIVSQQLLAQAARANNNVPGAAQKVLALEAQRTDLELQDYEGAMDGPDMAAALAAMRVATAAMTTTAARMTTVTAFIAHANDLIDGDKDVVSALQGAAQ